mmetsp:Transcript_14491/g.14453  ORF Transcript_14491/g.14453 Transcript_14491/m.14453 type:complete len:131 (+) Transcript_14491:128-520(+)
MTSLISLSSGASASVTEDMNPHEVLGNGQEQPLNKTIFDKPRLKYRNKYWSNKLNLDDFIQLENRTLQEIYDDILTQWSIVNYEALNIEQVITRSTNEEMEYFNSPCSDKKDLTAFEKKEEENKSRYLQM